MKSSVRCAAWQGPRLPSLSSADSAIQQASVELPGYDVRRILTARDPLAVMDAFYIQVRLRLATILGIRMCPRCPRCNDDANPPCQNKFGSNAIPMGGILGAGMALGSAIEHQGHGTPHLHGDVHIACVYQLGR